jgi:hypothetical protein
MRVSKFKIALVFILIFSVTSCQVIPSFADSKNKKIPVAFIGIKYENVSPDIQDVISWRMAAIIETQKTLIVTKPDAARIVHGRSKIAELLEKQDVPSFLTIAEKLGFDHVFAGRLTNQSEDADQTFLVGELNRFDLATQEIHTYKINHDYERFGNELVNFKEQYVEHLVTTDKGRGMRWSLLFAGGIVIVAALTIRLALGSVGDTNEGGDPGTGTGDNLYK